MLFRQIKADDHKPRFAFAVWPGRQSANRMQELLNAMNDDRTVRLFRQLHNALHPQQLLAMNGTQKVKKHFDRSVGDRPVMG